MVDFKDLDPCDTQCHSPDNMSCSNIIIMHTTNNIYPCPNLNLEGGKNATTLNEQLINPSSTNYKLENASEYHHFDITLNHILSALMMSIKCRNNVTAVMSCLQCIFDILIMF